MYDIYILNMNGIYNDEYDTLIIYMLYEWINDFIWCRVSSEQIGIVRLQ